MGGAINLYGVSNPVPIAVTVVMAANASPPANTETNILDSGLIRAISGGVYYPVVFANICYQFGATLPTSVIFGARIGAGADFAQDVRNLASVAANSTVTDSYLFVGPPSVVPWQGAGSHIFVSINTGTTPVTTVSNYGTSATFFLFRAPDQ